MALAGRAKCRYPAGRLGLEQLEDLGLWSMPRRRAHLGLHRAGGEFLAFGGRQVHAQAALLVVAEAAAPAPGGISAGA